MKKQLHSRQIISATAMFVLLIAMIVAAYWLKWGWTGFPTKTLWDWLNLLGVLAIPVVAGFGVAWYTAKQTQASEAASEQQHKTELEIAAQRHKTELEITADNQRESVLQGYIDKMSELLLEKNLRQSGVEDEVRNIARMRTLTVLPRLDPIRKASVLMFLCESGLIDNGNRVIDLRGADLCGADLRHTHIYRGIWNEAAQDVDTIGVDLSGANLQKANLYGTRLWHSNLYGVDLREADLRYSTLYEAALHGANLSGANLYRAILNGSLPSSMKNATDEQLSMADLQGTTMPDGTIHP